VNSYNAKVRSFEGTQSSEGIQKVRDIDKVQAALLASQLRQKRPASCSATKARNSGRATSRSRSRSTQWSPASKGSPSTACMSTVKFVSSPTEMGEREGSAAAIRPSSLRRGKSTHSLDQSPPPGPKKKQEKKHGEGATFAIRKDKLVACVKETMSAIQLGKPSSMMSSLKKAVDELAERKGVESDCPFSSQGLMAEMGKLVVTGADIVKRAVASKLDSLQRMELSWHILACQGLFNIAHVCCCLLNCSEFLHAQQAFP
jgi:hypothetical protein